MAAECAVPECIDGIQFFWVLHGKRFIVICHTLYIFGHFFTLFYCIILLVRGPRIIMSCQCLWENVTIHFVLNHVSILFYVFERRYTSYLFILVFCFISPYLYICNISRKAALVKFTNIQWHNFLEKKRIFCIVLLYFLTITLFAKYFPRVSPKQ